MFGPLRTLGVPEPVIDVVEPFFKVIVDLGYDRSIPPWEPTPARLIPPLNPVTVAGDLVNAVGEGINNAAALIGSPAPLSIPAAPATADQNAAVEQVLSAPGTTLKRVGRDVGDHTRSTTTIGAVKSVIGNGRTIVRSARSDNGSHRPPPTGAEDAAAGCGHQGQRRHQESRHQGFRQHQEGVERRPRQAQHQAGRGAGATP